MRRGVDDWGKVETGWKKIGGELNSRAGLLSIGPGRQEGMRDPPAGQRVSLGRRLMDQKQPQPDQVICK